MNDHPGNVIFGKPVYTKFGGIKPLCSAIGSRDGLQKCLLFVRGHQANHNFDKLAYAYRLVSQPDFFLTQKQDKSIQDQMEQGLNQDQFMNGIGQKLLHILRKFNVRNVAIIVIIDHRFPLSNLSVQIYRTIIKSAKSLINQLYEKLLKSTKEQPTNFKKTLNQQQKITMPQPKIKKQHPRTNRFQHPDFVTKSQVSKQQLRNIVAAQHHKRALQQNLHQLQDLIQTLCQQKLINQFKVLVHFNQDLQSKLVTQLFAQTLNLQDILQFLQADVKQIINSFSNQLMPITKLRRIREIMLSGRIKKNQLQGVSKIIFSALHVLIRRQQLLHTKK